MNRPTRRHPRSLIVSLALGLLLTLPGPARGQAVPAAPATSVAPAPEPFAKEIAAFVASDRTNPPPTGAALFIGSSSIRLWKTLAADFPNHRVVNRGFGGSEIVHSINYFDRIVRPYRPSLIVLYAGGNDINAGKSPAQVAADFRAFARKVRSALPETRLAYISIAPNPARWAQIEKVRAANREIQEFIRSDPNMRYIDAHTHMLTAEGLPKPDIFVSDRLHMNAEGYRIWARVVAPYLDDWSRLDSR